MLQLVTVVLAVRASSTHTCVKVTLFRVERYPSWLFVERGEGCVQTGFNHCLAGAVGLAVHVRMNGVAFAVGALLFNRAEVCAAFTVAASSAVGPRTRRGGHPPGGISPPSSVQGLHSGSPWHCPALHAATRWLYVQLCPSVRFLLLRSLPAPRWCRVF